MARRNCPYLLRNYNGLLISTVFPPRKLNYCENHPMLIVRKGVVPLRIRESIKVILEPDAAKAAGAFKDYKDNELFVVRDLWQLANQKESAEL